MTRFLRLCFLLISAGASHAQEGLPDFETYPKLHAYNEFGDAPLYGRDYTQLDYLNPDAPVGGVMRTAFSVPWQGFSNFGTGNGQSAPSISANTYESLFAGNGDEVFTAYVYLAEYYQIAEDRSWILFKVRDDARWWDGTPVTNRDVQFTIEKQSAEGFPGLISSVMDLIDRTELLDNNRILFFVTPEGQGERDFPLSVGGLDILPEAFWGSRSFSEPLLDPPLGSGPYRVTDFELGERLVYERVDTHWGLAHPLNRGTNLAQRIEIETIREREAQRLAFLGRELDQFSENVMERWINGYDSQLPLIEAGVMRKEEIFDPGLQGAQMAFFNLRNSKFQDPRVRRALALAFDFETMNEQFFFGQYQRNNSYYVGYEPLTARGPAEGLELELLEKYRDTLSDAAFAANLGTPWVNPVTAGNGDNTEQLEEALGLLFEAGFSIDGDRLLDPNGAAFTIQIDFYLPTFERIWQSYRQSLEALGITVDLRLIDQGVWFENLRNREFEMVSFAFNGSRTPGNDFRAYFSTEFTNTPNSFGFAGVTDPFIDALVDEALQAEDLETLEAIGRLVDRHMRNQNYTVLFWNYPFIRLLSWDVFGRPSDLDGIREPFETAATLGWWFDEVRQNSLPARLEAALQ